MSLEQTETEVRGTKRSLKDIDDINVPNAKRRKISSKNNEKENKNTNAMESSPPNTTQITDKKPEITDEKKQQEPIKPPLKCNNIPIEIKQLIESYMIKQNIKSQQIKNIRYVENERISIYKSENKLFENCKHILSIEYLNQNEIFEKIIIINDKNEIENIEIEDKVMMDDISISEGIEYTFDGIKWFIGEITYSSLEYYKRSKFSDWKKQITNPVCEAAFKRLLCIGLITNIFDRFVFKSAENEINNWKVKDNNGKIVNIPRPVKLLRKWNVKKREYENINPHLNGAPNKENEKEYWENMINEFKKEQGEEYINNLMASFNTKKTE